MKDEKFLTRSAFRLLALLLCLTASIPQLWADDFYVLSDVTTWNTSSLLNDNYKMIESNGEWTWSYTATTNRDIYFRILGRWSGGWYDNGIAPQTNGTAVTTSYQNCSWNNNNAWKIAVTAGNTYTFYLRNSNGNYQVKYSVASVPPTPHYYVTGDSGLGLDGWSPNPQLELTDSDNDGIYTYTATASATGTYGFVFANGQVNNDWNTFNSTYRIGPTNGNETATLNGSYQNTQLAGGDHGHYNVTVAAGTVTFSLNTNTTPMQFKVEGTAPATYNYTFYVKKNDALTSSPYLYLWDSNQNDLNGGWPGTNTNVTEVLADEKTWYKFTGAYIVQSVNAIVNKGNGQNQTNDITGLTPGIYYITWDGSNKDDNGLVVTTTAPTAIIYYVVGDEALIGHDWATDDDVVMTNNSWTKTGIHLNMGKYNLKVLDSDGNWYGDVNGDNVIVTANESGTYTLTVTRDPNTGVVTASLDPTAIDATQTYNIYVRYTGNESPENVYMHAWNVVTEYDQMPGIKFSTMTTEMINGYLYYKYTIDNTTASSIGLLFNENGSDQTKTADLTAQPGNNYFTYGGGSTVSGPTTTPDESATYYITGSEALGLGWSHDAPTAMTLDQTTGHYTYTYEVTESGIYNFVFANGTSDNWDDFNTQYRIGPSGATDVSITPNNNWNNTQMANGSTKAYSVKLNPGTVTITFDPTTNNMRFKVDGQILTHNYTFYVLPSDHSTTPYMYLWGLGTDEAFHNDYPGTALTTTVLLDDGNYWHVLNVDLTAEFIHALVNGGTPQDISNADNTKTANITHIDPGTYYIYWTTTREDGQQYNDYILTNVPPTHPGGTLYMIGTYYYDKHQYTYDPNSGVQLKYDANSHTYYLNNVNLAVNNTFCFTTNLSANWDNVGTRYGNGGPTYTEGDNTTNYFEINENYINKKLNLDEWNENFGEFRITVPGIYNVLVNPEGKWIQLIKTDYYALTPMNVFLEQTPNVTMPADYIQQPGTEYTNSLFNGGNWPLAAYNEANGGGQWDPTDNGNHYPVTFIGDTVTADGKHWWHWQVNASIAEIFFTRANEPNQSNIIRRKSGVLWVTWDEVDGEATLTDHSREYFEAAANALPTNAVVMEGHYYVYFINTVDWDKVYCYAWDNNPVLDDQGNPVFDGQGNPVIDNYFHDGYSRQMNDWPGQPCELVGIDPVTGYEVWRYDFGTIIGTDIPNGGIIFNDGNEYAETEAKEQTGDFEYINGAVYDYLGMVDGAYTLNNLIRTAAEEVRYTVSNDLLAVYYDPKAVTRIDYKNAYEEDVHEYITGALYAKDLNQYGEKSIMPDDSYTDYVYQTCASNHTSGRSQIMIKRTTYDQSNWVKLVMSPNYDNRHEVVAPGDRPNLADYVGHIIPAGTLDVFMTDTINPTAHVLAIQMGETMSYEPNVYISSHFNDTVVFNYTHKDWQLGEYNGNYRTQPHITWTFNEENQAISGVATRERVSEDPYYMYYVAPKPQEIAYITWVVYDNYNMDNAWPGYCKHTQWTGEGGWSYQPYTTPNPHVIPPEDPGRFYAPMNWNRRTEIPGEAYDQLQYLAGDVLDKALGAWDPDYGPYSNGYMQYGAMKVNWSLFQEETPWWQIFTPGQAYKFMAIIRYARGSGYNPDPESGDIDDTADNYYYGPSIGYFEDGEEHTYSDGHTVFNAPRRDNDNGLSGYANMYFCGDYTDAGLDRSKFIIFPIKASAQRSNGDGMGNVTAVNEVFSDVTSSRTVVGVSYYNLMGVKSDKPFDGINIVVTNYSDGSCSSRKILR